MVPRIAFVGKKIGQLEVIIAHVQIHHINISLAASQIWKSLDKAGQDGKKRRSQVDIVFSPEERLGFVASSRPRGSRREDKVQSRWL